MFPPRIILRWERREDNADGNQGEGGGRWRYREGMGRESGNPRAISPLRVEYTPSTAFLIRLISYFKRSGFSNKSKSARDSSVSSSQNARFSSPLKDAANLSSSSKVRSTVARPFSLLSRQCLSMENYIQF